MEEFVLALAEGGESDMPASEGAVIDESTPTGVKQAAAKQSNAVGMFHLLMAFEKEADLGLVYKTMTKDWPGGRCHEVVSLLKKNYQPSNTTTLDEVNQILTK